MEAISEMIAINHTQKLEKFLSTYVANGPSKSIQTKEFEELFVYASYKGNLNCLRLLRRFVFSDVSFLDSLQGVFGRLSVSPLRVAVEYDNTDCVEWLCCQGADVNLRETVWSTKSDGVTSGTFIAHSCRVPCMTALHFARSSSCVRILLESGADMSVQDCMGKTPVAMATLDGRLEVLETLCKHRAPVNLASTWGATPLIYAQYGRSKHARVSATEILCRAGADVNIQDRNGRSALHVARDLECVSLILNYHGEPTLETIFGKTALVTAAEHKRWDICHVLLDAEPVPSLGGLGRGSSLSSSLTREDQIWLITFSKNVRNLTHLCRCVIRNQLKTKNSNISEGIRRLSLPWVLKVYLLFLAS